MAKFFTVDFTQQKWKSFTKELTSLRRRSGLKRSNATLIFDESDAVLLRRFKTETDMASYFEPKATVMLSPRMLVRKSSANSLNFQSRPQKSKSLIRLERSLDNEEEQLYGRGVNILFIFKVFFYFLIYIIFFFFFL